MTINAIYEQGVFKPTDSVDLEEGTQVQVIVQDQVAGPDPQEAARLLKAISEIPMQGKGGFSGKDHDSVLYGQGYGA